MSSYTKGIRISGTHRTVPEELFAVKSGDNSSCSCFCLCRGLPATSGQPQSLSPVAKMFLLMFPSRHLPTQQCETWEPSALFSPVLCARDFRWRLRKHIGSWNIAWPWEHFNSKPGLQECLGYHTESPDWVNWMNPFEQQDITWQIQHVPVPPCLSQESHCSPAHWPLSSEIMVSLIHDASLLFTCSFYKYLSYTPFISFAILALRWASIVSTHTIWAEMSCSQNYRLELINDTVAQFPWTKVCRIPQIRMLAFVQVEKWQSTTPNLSLHRLYFPFNLFLLPL